MDRLHFKSLQSTLQYSTLKYYVTLFVQYIQSVECAKSNLGMYKIKSRKVLNQNDF